MSMGLGTQMKIKLILITLIILIVSFAVFAQPIIPSGTRFFKYLLDTPDSYTDQGGKGVRVNTAEDAVEFYTISTTLGDDTDGNYVAAVADGTGIDGTASSEGATYTPTFDATELDALTWSDNANASNIWTFDVSGTDHTMTAGSALMTFSGGLTTTLDLIVTGGDITLGTTSIFSGGDTASLNNIDALNATTEATIESAIDTLSNLTSIGTIATGTWEATDVGVAHGGTGASTLTDGFVLLGSGTAAITPLDVTTDGAIVIGDGTTDPTTLDVGSSTAITILGTIATGVWQATDVGVAYGGTGASTLTDGGVLLGSGTSAITAMSVLGDGAIIVGDNSTDPVALTAFSSSTGDLKHEAGGLEADVSGYTDGIYGMASGATLDIDTIAEIETAIGGSTNILTEGEIDASSELLALMDDETGTGLLVFATAPTFTTSIKITGADANPGAAGVIVYDSTVSGMSGGALRWYDDDSVRLIVDLETDATDDDYVVAYDSAADGFYMKADADSGGATAYDNIGNPTGAGSIGFDDTETATYSTAQNTADSFMTIDNTVADVTNNVYLLDLDYSVDDNQANADYFKCQDAGGVVLSIQQNGDLASTGTIEGATLTEGGVAVHNNDQMDASSELLAIFDDETGTGVIVFGTAPTFTTSITITGADASPDAAGEIQYDSTVSGMSGGGLRWYDDDSVRLVVDLETDPSNDDYVVTYDADADGFYMKADATGATAWDDIGDPDAAATVDFATYTQTIDIGVTDDGGPKSGLILDVTGLGAGTSDVIALEITTATNDDTDYIPIAVYDDSGADNDLIFKVDSIGRVTMNLGGSIHQNTNDQIVFTENSDVIQFGYPGSNLELKWGDGVLNIKNIENGVDGIVQIAAGNNGDKGVLRVLSDGVDKYIELYHDDTDGHIVTDTGDIHIEANGGDINFDDDNITTTGTATFAGGTLTGDINAGGADLELPQGQTPDTDGDIDLDFTDGSVVVQHGSAHAELGAATDVVVGKLIKSFAATIFAPDGVNDVIPLKMIDDLEFPHGVVIVECLLQVGTDSNYTLTLQNYDDFDTINGANGTIDAVAYTAGNDGEVTDTSITYGTIAAGQIIMMSIPSTDVDWVHIEVFYYEPIA